MNIIDKKTFDLIDERYGVVEVIGRVISYIQESNKELVELKKVVAELTGKDPAPRTPEQLRKLREGGDILRDIQKILDLNKKIKGG